MGTTQRLEETSAAIKAREKHSAEEAALFVQLCELTEKYVRHVGQGKDDLMVDLTCTLEAVAENLLDRLTPDEVDPHTLSASMRLTY